jgi:NAD(P)-binding Rossmann-like domain
MSSGTPCPLFAYFNHPRPRVALARAELGIYGNTNFMSPKCLIVATDAVAFLNVETSDMQTNGRPYEAYSHISEEGSGTGEFDERELYRLPRDELGTKRPTRTARACIIGGGASGLTAALELAKAGFVVTVLEGSHRWGGGSKLSISTMAHSPNWVRCAFQKITWPFLRM